MQAKIAPILGRPIRVALIGCGRIAKHHIEAIQGYPHDLHLVAVCDEHAPAREAAAAATQATPYAHLSAVLTNSDADLVVITTPSGFHAEQAISAAKAGRHIITEKPMATRWEDGVRMVNACDAANVHLLVVKQNRFNPPLQALKHAITQQRFGRIHLVVVNVFWMRPQSYYDSASWRGTAAFDGGALMNQASHYIDLLDWLVGSVASVQAYTETLARQIEMEDTAVVGVQWHSGTMGSLNVTMLTYPHDWEGSITLIGERGTVRVGGVALNEIQTWTFDTMTPEDTSIRDVNYTTDSVYGFGHRRYYENAIAVLRGKTKPETDGREGLKSLALITAAYQSAKEGRRIWLSTLL